ncbi:hypothetical protein B0H10DRAFT_1971019 [Mycena sp. CBHHK59/15]|nr:hypothetical protein B0H10DRAFT_1971019 [Mycena sp. CBHHK59/15]
MPIQVLSDGLREFLQRSGMMAAVNLWKIRPRTPGESKTIQDGEIWEDLKGFDGQQFFFGDSSEREIRIGTTFSLDWFSPKTSPYGQSHSAGVFHISDGRSKVRRALKFEGYMSILIGLTHTYYAW